MSQFKYNGNFGAAVNQIKLLANQNTPINPKRLFDFVHVTEWVGL